MDVVEFVLVLVNDLHRRLVVLSSYYHIHVALIFDLAIDIYPQRLYIKNRKLLDFDCSLRPLTLVPALRLRYLALHLYQKKPLCKLIKLKILKNSVEYTHRYLYSNRMKS